MTGSTEAVVLLMVLYTASGNTAKVLLVSMDGFRWDYIKNIPNLGNFSTLASTGVSVDYVNNTFATKTFPCHYTIATGLYEENHGIVANTMYDPVRNANFNKASRETFWWDGGEPMWITAVKQNKSAGTFFWVGSEVDFHGFRPNVWLAYDESIPFHERVERSISWFVDKNLDLVNLYFHEPDSTGHMYGPDSKEVISKVVEMDAILGLILKTLEQKGLTDTVNLIVTSDHGMASVDYQTRLIDMWSVFPNSSDERISLVKRVVDQGTLTAILPQPGREPEVAMILKNLSHVTVYLKEDMPEHFYYKNNARIMPVLVLADEGWLVTSDWDKYRSVTGKGEHGYSNDLPSMKAIFLARGPNFRKGVQIPSIRSVDIYPLVCKLLDITPAPNNGSLENTAQFLVTTSTACRQTVVLWYQFLVILTLSFLS